MENINIIKEKFEIEEMVYLNEEQLVSQAVQNQQKSTNSSQMGAGETRICHPSVRGAEVGRFKDSLGYIGSSRSSIGKQ